jgi:hypothetical protein
VELDATLWANDRRARARAPMSHGICPMCAASFEFDSDAVTSHES